MSETKQKIRIKSYNDFVERLKQIEEIHIDVVLSFYKFCTKRDDKFTYKIAKELIIEELEPTGLKPFKITKDINLIFRYKKIAEAVVLVRDYGIDLLIYKL